MSAPPPQRQSDPPASYASRQGPPQGPPPQSFGVVQPPHQSHVSQPYNNTQGLPGPPMQQHERSFSQGQPLQQYNTGSMSSMGGPQMGGPQMGGPQRGTGPVNHGSYNTGSISSNGPPQLSTLPFQTSQTPPPIFPQQQPPPAASYSQSPPASYSQSPININSGNLPPLKPVFGLSLEELFQRDGSAVPMVVYQCIQGVDLFGLEVEGIYRLSGTASHITRIKAMFDNGKCHRPFLHALTDSL